MSLTSAYNQSQQQMQIFSDANGTIGQHFSPKLENGCQVTNANGFCYSNSSTLLSPYNHQLSPPIQLENSHMNNHMRNNNNNNHTNNNNNKDCEAMCNATYDNTALQNFFDPNAAILYQQNQPPKTSDTNFVGTKTEITSHMFMTDLNLSKSPQTVLDLESGTIHNRQCDTCEATYDVKEHDLIRCGTYKSESVDDSASLVSSSSIFDDGYYSIPLNHDYNLESYTEQNSYSTYHTLNMDKGQIIHSYNSSPTYYTNTNNFEVCPDPYPYSTMAYVPEYISFDSNTVQFNYE